MNYILISCIMWKIEHFLIQSAPLSLKSEGEIMFTNITEKQLNNYRPVPFYFITTTNPDELSYTSINLQNGIIVAVCFSYFPLS